MSDNSTTNAAVDGQSAATKERSRWNSVAVLTAKLTVLLLGIGALGWAVWLGSTLSRGDNTSKTTAVYNMFDIADGLEAGIYRTVRPAMKRTQILAEDPKLIQAVRSGDSHLQTQLLNTSIKSSTEIDAVAVFDSSGKISAVNTCYASGAPIETNRIERILGQSFKGSGIIESCLRNASLAPAIQFQTKCRFTPALFDSTGLSVACSVPIVDPTTGEKAGVVSTRIRFERLSQLAQARSMAGGAAKAYFITDAGGYFSESINSGREQPPVPEAVLKEIVRTLPDEPGLPRLSRRDTKYLAVFSLPDIQTIEGGHIHILIIADESWIMRGPRQERLLRAAVCALVGALLLIVSGLMHLQSLAHRSIAERKRVEAKIRHLALHDALTGLANRFLLMDRIEHCIQQSKRDPAHTFAVVFIDLDRFKIINDSLGHDAGDKLLIGIAQRLITATRGADTVSRFEPDHLARLGGDEFVVLLEKVSGPQDAMCVCQRIQAGLAEPYHINGQEVRSSASLGIAISDGNYHRADEILRDADTALYAAKDSGRANFRIFHADMHAQAMKRLWIERELRHAIDHGDLFLVYQPVIDLVSGRMIEVEALVRWRHAERGIIPPLEFIPVAEETGLISRLGTWVMQEACRQLMFWRQRVPELNDLKVAVNVSLRQFARRDVPAVVSNILDETGLDAQSLILEITESAIIGDASATLDEMQALHEKGVGIHLDDFGTGYSSLGMLHQMPLEVLKIDRSFVSAMDSADSGATSIVQAIMALAHSLHLQVIAEGVETQHQMDQLIGYGCDYAQGYYLSKPITADEVILFARRQCTQGKAAA